MRITGTRLVPFLLLLAALSCSADATAPRDVILETATALDPTGDTFGSTGTFWDLTALTVSRDSDAVIVKLDLTTTTFSSQSNIASGMIGFIDFDTDQDVSTGLLPTIDDFRPTNGTSVLGADYEVAMLGFTSDSTVAVVDTNGTVTGRVKPEFRGKSVTIRIPRTMLGNDDGFVNVAAIVGTSGRPTDLVPESGHLTLNPKTPD